MDVSCIKQVHVFYCRDKIIEDDGIPNSLLALIIGCAVTVIIIINIAIIFIHKRRKHSLDHES